MKSKVLAPLIALVTVASLGIGWTVFAGATPERQLATYRNDAWHFSITVPATMQVDESEHRGAAQVINFTDPSTAQWFNIVAEPYMEMDVALGEEGAPNTNTDQSTQLGVVNVYRDDTYSVAFHRNGIAYTIATGATDAQGNATWLLPIVQSWEFTN